MLPQLIIVKQFHLVICLLAVLLADSSCKKSAPPAPKPDADVYVVGFSLGNNSVRVASYWKNGTLVKLTNDLRESHANAIAVDGNDVYIAGYITNDHYFNTAVYWKNGVITKLGNDTTNSKAYGIAIQDGNVYVVGDANIIYTNQGKPYASPIPTYWKNGLATSLPSDLEYICTNSGSIAAQGADLYILGLFEPSYNNPLVTYWKNGVVSHYANSPNSIASENSIFVSGPNVYVAGYTSVYTSTIPSPPSATYWKDGMPNVVASNSIANDIKVKGTDLYMAGVTLEKFNNSIATYWKNGQTIKLADSLSYSEANALTLNGNDVYIAGMTSVGAAYWKNGIVTQLSTQYSDGFAIAVVPN